MAMLGKSQGSNTKNEDYPCWRLSNTARSHIQAFPAQAQLPGQAGHGLCPIQLLFLAAR
jgi:hypothetical protein